MCLARDGRWLVSMEDVLRTSDKSSGGEGSALGSGTDDVDDGDSRPQNRTIRRVPAIEGTWREGGNS